MSQGLEASPKAIVWNIYHSDDEHMSTPSSSASSAAPSDRRSTLPPPRLFLPSSISDPAPSVFDNMSDGSRSQSPEATRSASPMPPQGTRPDAPLKERTLLLAWGANANGQLGLGDFAPRIYPQPLAYFKSASLSSVVCGSRTTLALDTEGRVFSWGKGEDGTLGTGERGTVTRPRLVEGLMRQPISQMACRGAHVLALTVKGQLWAWGRDDDGQLGTLRRDHSGSGERTALPQRVSGLVGTRIAQIACGRKHSVALDSSGRVYSWGCGDDGVLGHGDTRSRSAPTQCAGLAAHTVKSIACGSRHTLALTQEGGVHSWGWGVYGQLGHGDLSSILVPREVQALLGLQLIEISCGYRHSMVLSSEPPALFAWGWGRHGQLGLGHWSDVSTPQQLSSIDASSIERIVLGGRHSLAVCTDGSIYAWGLDDDGQLGLGAQGGSCEPRLIAPLSAVGIFPIAASAGWSHTALLVSVPARLSLEQLSPAHVADAAPRTRPHRLFVRGDFEGLFGQLLGTSIQFLLMKQLLSAQCGFPEELIVDELLPGAGFAYLFGHLFFAVQATRLTRSTNRPVTALPQGINIVTFFAFTQLIMTPAFVSAKQQGLGTAQAARVAYDNGLCACLLLGLLELCGVPFVEALRKGIPRAAMLSAIAGVSLTFVAMGFAMQIFAAPGTAVVSMFLMLIFYAGNVKLPLKVPGGILAVAVSVAIASCAHSLGYVWFDPPQLQYTPSLHLPTLQLSCWQHLLDPSFYQCISVVVPMWLVNLVNNLANIEAAEAVGDTYDTRSCLLGTAFLDIIGPLLGNPFPCCVYIGHAAFKAMGCRVGYLYLNMVPTAFFALMKGAGLLTSVFPMEAGVGFLMWIGLQITAAGFEGDQTPEGWRHGPAVALGLVPSIAAWSWQSVSTTYAATRSMLCAGFSAEERAAAEPCSMELQALIDCSLINN